MIPDKSFRLVGNNRSQEHLRELEPSQGHGNHAGRAKTQEMSHLEVLVTESVFHEPALRNRRVGLNYKTAYVAFRWDARAKRGV